MKYLTLLTLFLFGCINSEKGLDSHPNKQFIVTCSSRTDTLTGSSESYYKEDSLHLVITLTCDTCKDIQIYQYNSQFCNVKETNEK